MKKIPWKYILIGIIGLVLSPLLPILVAVFVSYKIFKSGLKQKLALIVLTVVVGVAIMPRWIELFPKKENSTVTQQNDATATTGTSQSTTSAQPLTTPVVSVKPQIDSSQPTREKTSITKVVDGDTVEVTGGLKVRYIGMDTPEISGSVDCYGQEATNKNKELVKGKAVELEKDVSETDKYGRLLRYVYINGQMINEILVKEGYAKVATYSPDVKYKDTFLAAEQEARKNNKGLWGNACACTQEIVSTQCSTCNTSTVTKQKYDCSTYQQTQTDTSCAYLCPASKTEPTPAPAPTTQKSADSYICNCRKTCPNMSSCGEAQYQLNTCGCTARDADHDGIACDADCQ